MDTRFVVALILSALLAMASAGQKPKDAEVLEDSGKDDLKTASSYGYGYAVGYPGYHYGGWYPYHGYGYGHYYGYGYPYYGGGYLYDWPGYYWR